MSELSKISAAPSLSRQATVVSVSEKAVGTAQTRDLTGNNLPPTPKSASALNEPLVSADETSAQMRERVSAAVMHMNQFVQASQRDLSFMYDADRGETVVQVLDRNTREVIRQIPDAIFLKIAEQISNESPGALLSARV